VQTPAVFIPWLFNEPFFPDLFGAHQMIQMVIVVLLHDIDPFLQIIITNDRKIDI